MKKINTKLLCKTLGIGISATLAIALSSCTTTVQQADSSVAVVPVYDSKPLYFHYFSIDVPNEIDLDKSIMETSFAGNRFHAYPIESQKAFTELVESRIAVFENHKISQKAKDFENDRYEILNKLNLEENKKNAPRLNMTTALYQAIKYDDRHYEIIANPLSNLDSTFNTAMYGQLYIYIPEQHKYVMTKQGKFPASYLIEVPDQKASGQKFLDTQIRPLNKTTLSNPKTMALGPIAWIDADSHPDIHYILESTQLPMRIELESSGYSDDRYDQTTALQKRKAKQLKSNNNGKERHLDSGSRTLAGMKGREVCYYYPRTEYVAPYVWCSWGTDGKAEDLDNPFIYLNMYYKIDGSETSRKQAMQAWEQLLESFKRRGRS